jgi:hypothetical protein
MYLLRHNPEHRWFFLQDQSLDEVWLWRNADKEGVRPSEYRFTSHSARAYTLAQKRSTQHSKTRWWTRTARFVKALRFVSRHFIDALKFSCGGPAASA